MPEPLALKDFNPRPSLVTPVTPIDKPRFRVIDAHNHLDEGFGGGWIHRPVRELLDVLDQAGVGLYVDLDGGWGEQILQRHLDHFKAAAPERFVQYAGIDWTRWPELGSRFAAHAAARLREQARWGAEGLKVWKNFGLHVKDEHGQRAPLDDPRLDELWQTAADLKLPVTIHAADPVAFFDPLTPANERWEELEAHPEWHFPSPPFPPFRQIMDELASLVARWPQITFVGAHVGCYAENLAWVSDLLDRCPNFNVDISARLGELGRQPYAARRFFLRHPDRILFGVDSSPNTAEYQIYYRFLETGDEYFDYGADETPKQGRWRIYGIHLPDDVLEKVYHKNAERILRRQV